MHEMSLAMNIVEMAVAAASREGAVKINEVELVVGELSGVLIDSLEFCLEAAARDTTAGTAVFKIIPVKGRGNCRNCDASFELDSLVSCCPHCGEYTVEVIGGKELNLQAITIDE
ncbi:MAG: hydrogenase maturation nickel metallochaperone HypA [Proteobacteria bacterium]|nr:hydrogenase maturation nickel metallochaperone HypA [Pseudomonadota bacterium]MBU1717040.1 hydrogenase maturation nickel metallochaperone HypA [Pseudomonadota bacterium]